MKSFRETAIPRATGAAGLLAAVFLFAGPGVVQAQQTPPPPERDPPSLRPVPPLRDAPAEQFAACADITDRAARGTCIGARHRKGMRRPEVRRNWKKNSKNRPPERMAGKAVLSSDGLRAFGPSYGTFWRLTAFVQYDPQENGEPI